MTFAVFQLRFDVNTKPVPEFPDFGTKFQKGNFRYVKVMVKTMDVMRCFPQRLRTVLTDAVQSWNAVTEVRLRAGSCSAIAYRMDGRTVNKPLPALGLDEDELREVLSRLCAGSVHVYDEGLLRGYFSPQLLPGVRVGAAGRLLCSGGKPERLQRLTSLCIRLPHTVTPDRSVTEQLVALVQGAVVDAIAIQPEPNAAPLVSTLFYSPPGVGKTTLLRCLIRALCSAEAAGTPVNAAVLDTGEELCAEGFSDCTVDRFSGYPRGLGMEIATRAFAPQVLICDEIGSDAEAEEILRAQACGVPLIATAHADTLQTLLRRPCFARLHDHGVFSRYVRLHRTANGQGFAFVCEGST